MANQHIKGLFYGAPGIGKSVFAGNFPKPFFITTDGNYEFLEGMVPDYDESNHVQVFTWQQAKNAFSMDFANYDTVVIDLIEDLYKFAEQDFLKENKIQSLADLPFGKAYDCVRNDFIVEVSRLMAINKNVVLLSHEISTVTKNRRGVEYTAYRPSNRMPDKVLDVLEGRLKYCLRVFGIAEDNDGRMVVNRYLSLAPDGTNEWGILRGLDTSALPEYIPLDYETFVSVIEQNKPTKYCVAPAKPNVKQAEIIPGKKETPAPTPAEEVIKKATTIAAKSATIADKVAESPLEAASEAVTVNPGAADDMLASLKSAYGEPEADEAIEDTTATETAPVAKRGRPRAATKEDTAEAPAAPAAQAPTGTGSNADRLAKLQAQLAAIKARKQ